MLNMLLDRVASLVPKYFIISYFVPTLAAAFVNVLILYSTSWEFQQTVDHRGDNTQTLFLVLAALVAVVVLAYGISGIGVTMRETLEGCHIWPRPLRRLLQGDQQRIFDRLRAKYELRRNQRALLEEQKLKWPKDLRIAAAVGARKKGAHYDAENPAAKEIEKLRAARDRVDVISFEELQNAVDLLTASLQRVNKWDPNEGKLASDSVDALKLIDYAIARQLSTELSTLHQLQFEFGTSVVAPTKMGNIAASVQGYAFSRYAFDVPTFWNRLQTTIETNPVASATYYAGLQDAKAQLDFVITAWWLCASTVVGWAIAFAVWGVSLPAFLIVTLVGPFTCYGIYSLANASYITFTDLVRTGIDLYRLELLGALHFAKPTDPRDEQQIWKKLQRSAAFGEPNDLKYQF